MCSFQGGHFDCLRVGKIDFPFLRLQLMFALFNDISLSISCWFSIRFVLIAFTDTNFQEVKRSNAFLPIEKVSQCKRRMCGLCLCICVCTWPDTYVSVSVSVYMCV